MPHEVRRVVTANTEEGRSYFMSDGAAGQVLPLAGRGLTFFELWETDGPLACNMGTEDAGARPVRHHPPLGGTRFRIVELLPEQGRSDAEVSKDFAEIDAAGIQIKGSEDPTMHRNETVDYNIILSGEVFAVTDAGETLLRAGDVLIQRGTAHTWRNRSDRPCVFASVMVSAAAHPLFTSETD